MIACLVRIRRRGQQEVSYPVLARHPFDAADDAMQRHGHDCSISVLAITATTCRAAVPRPSANTCAGGHA